jgi:hypothetical protein
MNDVNPYFGVTVAVFAVYVVLAALGSRERDDAAPRRARDLRRRLRGWMHNS